MIHRAPFGSLERFCAVLIEHTAGHFPLWLTPDQVAILPISEKYNDYAKRVSKYLDEQGVRATIDDRNEKIGRKIRDNEIKRVPYMVIVGEKEAADGLVSMRCQGGGEQATMRMDEFAKRVNGEVAGRQHWLSKSGKPVLSAVFYFVFDRKTHENDFICPTCHRPFYFVFDKPPILSESILVLRNIKELHFYFL